MKYEPFFSLAHAKDESNWKLFQNSTSLQNKSALDDRSTYAQFAVQCCGISNHGHWTYRNRIRIAQLSLINSLFIKAIACLTLISFRFVVSLKEIQVEINGACK